jgi:chemotaxis protein methyltransferase WspC
MSLASFEHLLKQTMGLDAASIGSRAVERAVRERQSICEMKDLQAYLELVRRSEAELQQLVEAVVVPETWFFRDPEALAAMGRLMCSDRLPRTSDNNMLRLLSLPCSTGEEPYSMAMTLLDVGIPAGRFAIDAIDISAAALGKAGRAVYGRNSFRSSELGFRDRHFEHTAQGYRLAEAVRQHVHFQQGNVLAPGFLPGVEVYDVIFCRNVLIYFDEAAQDRVVEVLARLLKPDGFLFVGPSETGVLMRHAFVSMQIPLAFAFHKAPAATRVTARAPTRPSRRSPARIPALAPVTGARSVRATPAKAVESSPPALLHQAMTGIDDAERLANQGHMGEAAKYCEQHLREHGPSAKAFYILGLIRDARGDLMEAVGLYRKALYLDPDHHEALVHLAFLLNRQGDTAGAQVLQQRLRRLQQASTTPHARTRQ